jgi:hypothetical protein
MGKSHRTTITIPQGLKAQMDALEESVNWSAVACRAFKQKLAEVISQRGVKDIDDVVARLRASKQTVQEGRHKEGFEDGQRWAKQSASADELERLERMRDSVRDYEWDWLFSTDDRNFGRFTFFRTIHGADHDYDRCESDLQEFWLNAAGDDYEALTADGEYLRSFANGALDVWDEVKDQL